MLLSKKHILLCICTDFSEPKLKYITNNFCGTVVTEIHEFKNDYIDHRIIYLCGDIQKIDEKVGTINADIINVIKELSHNYSEKYNLINLGQVPINMYNTGVYFRELFGQDKNHFSSIVTEHKFQSLTESNKPGNAFRKGIYLTNVEQNEDETKFKLLRCSTNFAGPTDNFRSTDKEIVGSVNNLAKYFFDNPAELNHVLAQVYENKIVMDKTKKIEKKAKITMHSDKTKDMPENGLIAFCSFYDNIDLSGVKKSTTDEYDYCYNNDTSVLTKLRFRLKNDVNDKSLQKIFDVILYPNSVFIISLLTNRLYTHEIFPSTLPVDKIPIRMGYVIRCSNTDAVFKNNQTYILKDNMYIKLEPPTIEGVKELKRLYLVENLSTEHVRYNNFYFSLNEGDYVQPIF